MTIKQERLDEILGTLSMSQANRQQPGPTNTNTTGFESIPNARGVKLSFCNQMRPWQMEVANTLERSDAYVLAPPGAGKTMPLVCYWSHNILELNTRELFMNTLDQRTLQEFTQRLIRFLTRPTSFPKLMIAVPVISLCDNLQREFKRYLVEMLVQTYSVLQDVAITPANINHRRPIHQMARHAMDSFINALINQRSADPGLQRDVTTRDRLYGEYYASTNDEFQRRMRREIQTLEQLITQKLGRSLMNHVTNNLVCVLSEKLEKGAQPHRAPVIIGIYESLTENVVRVVRGNLGLFAVDESHLTQRYGEYDQDERENQIAINLYNILRAIDRNTRFVLMSGTINPTAAENLTTILNKCFRRDIRRINVGQMDPTAGNPSNLSVVPMDSLDDENTILNLMLNPKTQSNLIVIFGKVRIVNLILKAIEKKGGGVQTLSAVDRGANTPARYREIASSFDYTPQQRLPRTPDSLLNQNVIDAALKERGAQEITLPLQRQAVSMGMGFIFRIDEQISRELQSKIGYDPRLERQYYEDFRIVSRLFKEGAVHTVLVTDAVGIGVNLDAQNMYLPTAEKFTGVNVEKMKTAELSQMLNRTGRMAFKFSSIYTPKKHIPHVVEALSASPSGSGFEQRLNVANLPLNTICNHRNFFAWWWNRLLLGRVQRALSGGERQTSPHGSQGNWNW